MSDAYFGESSDPSMINERTDQVVNSPAINTDTFADKTPVDAAHIQETPMGGTLASVSPINEPLEAEVPMLETPLQEIPMGGTVAASGPMDETVVPEVPVIETIPYQVPVTGAITLEAPVIEPAPYQAPVIEPIPYQAPAVERMMHDAPVGTNVATLTPLLAREVSDHFRTRWSEIQGQFVDEPRSAVQQADTLVSEVIAEITQMFTREHSSLEGQWKQGENVSTEDLRKALQRYRSFFNRLVV
jgi:hypothetical protein